MWMPRRLLHVDASAPTLSYLIFRSRYTVVPATNKGPSTVTILAGDVSSSVNTTLIRPTIPPSTHCRRKPRIRLRCRHRPVSPRRGSPLPSAHRTGSWPATKPGKIANASTAIRDRTMIAPFPYGTGLYALSLKVEDRRIRPCGSTRFLPFNYKRFPLYSFSSLVNQAPSRLFLSTRASSRGPS